MEILIKISFFAAILLPFWNASLIMRVLKRRSSADISIWWAGGVWTCLLLMLPSGICSQDNIYRVFTITNFILFSITALVIVIYHKGR